MGSMGLAAVAEGHLLLAHRDCDDHQSDMRLEARRIGCRIGCRMMIYDDLIHEKHSNIEAESDWIRDVYHVENATP